MPSHKIARISADITRELSAIIFDSAKDELLKTVTITGCKLASDLSYAKIYFTSLSEIDRDTLVKEVNEASSFFRTELANRLDLRHTPELTFVYDTSIEYAKRIEDIIKENNKQ